MSDVVDVSPKAKSKLSRADQQAFTQVEKWLAIIRELVRQQAKS